ncbi:MAG: DUF2334 domain-containing protein [Peptococcaceae bacterium]|nr:DUF2334 domain-containing protein [Peptococcaceae bacterium]
MKKGVKAGICLCVSVLMGMAVPILHMPVLHAELAGEPAKTLILYTLQDESQIDQVNFLDLLVGQFTGDITVADAETCDVEMLDSFSNIVYFSCVEKALPARFTEALDRYSGPVFAIGRNFAQLGSQFSFVHTSDNEVITAVRYLPQEIEEAAPEKWYISKLEVHADAGVKILASATTKTKEQIPVIVQKGDRVICSEEILARSLTQALNGFFGEPHPPKITCYLRLEDVHPNADPERLREIAEYLAEKKIPYLIAVIPTYISGDREMHYDDAPKLVETLQYMQDHGASIILHGYRHQYRSDETGEGFEFWDVENDRPIYQERTTEALTRADFNSEAAYLDFLANGKAFEREYIERAIVMGVQELVTHKLYPVGFEAPHYSMSAQGYKVVSEYFSHYFGQVQLTDTTRLEAEASLMESQPAFFHGMRLCPETLGYIEERNELHSLESIRKTIQINRQYPNAYLSAFYHPYLGVEGLKALVDALEQVEGAEWLDPKTRKQWVHAGNIRITTGEGRVEVSKPLISGAYERDFILKNSVKWGVVVVWGGPFLITLVVRAGVNIYRRINPVEKGV